MSALTRIAYDEHRHIKAAEGDSLILSARIIPGNERSIFSMLNHFARRGVEVHRRPHEEVHTSGHAQREEMRTLISLVRPRHLIPVHGEIRHLIAHGRLAEECGIPRENVFVLENGNILELSADGARRAGDCIAGRVCVDGLGVGDISEVVLRDRKRLARDGMIVVTLVVNRQTRKIEAGPDIVSRGVADEEGDGELLEQCRRAALAAFKGLKRESREETPVVEEAMRLAIRRLIRKSLDRRPTVLPLVIEV
jgi:ribonuclease J